jgi:hypothetical protein
MFKATRDFIKARHKFTQYTPYVRTGVVRIGGGEANKCFENACAQRDLSIESGNKVVCMSGWLVQPYKKSTNSTAIIQHWWNVDSTGKHFDTSPLINDNEEYVMDFDLYEFGRINIDKIKSNVTMSLLYQDGKFSLLKEFNTMEFETIDELRTESFFQFLNP